MSKDYEKIYDKFIEYETHLHEKNQRKIKVGFKVNILLPLVFLFLCFIIPGTKFLFLMLWIISLFGIAAYLVYVEYTDYKMLSKMKEFGVYDEDIDRNLMGDDIDQALDEAKESIEERLNAEKINLESELEKINKQIEEKHKERQEKINRLSEKIRRKDS
ncbi:MAG: hypothetical protein IJU02_05620 [Lachnospiraceae bacterium]|nr:hypothetical protein [Lachnospiraceae bacterium]